MPEEIDSEKMVDPDERRMCSWLLLASFQIIGKTDNDANAAPNPRTRCTRIAITARHINPLDQSSDSRQESACTDVPLFFML